MSKPQWQIEAEKQAAKDKLNLATKDKEEAKNKHPIAGDSWGDNGPLPDTEKGKGDTNPLFGAGEEDIGDAARREEAAKKELENIQREEESNKNNPNPKPEPKPKPAPSDPDDSYFMDDMITDEDISGTVDDALNAVEGTRRPQNTTPAPKPAPVQQTYTSSYTPSPNPTPTPTPEPSKPTPSEIINAFQSGSNKELSGWQGDIGKGNIYGNNFNHSNKVGFSGSRETALSNALRDNQRSMEYGEGVDIQKAAVDPSSVLAAPGSNSIVNTRVGGQGTVANGISPKWIENQGGYDGGRFAVDETPVGGHWDENGWVKKSKESLGLGGDNNSRENTGVWNQGLNKNPTVAVSDKDMKHFCSTCKRDPVMRKVVLKVASKVK